MSLQTQRTSTFPNGQQLVVSGFSPKDFGSMFQDLLLQVLGVNASPFQIAATLTAGQFTATMATTAGLYTGLQLSGTGIPDQLVQIDEVLSQTEIMMSSPATASGAVTLTAADPQPYARVRLGWPAHGAPAWGQHQDVVFVLANLVDDAYGKIRDLENATASDTQVGQTYSYTRVWEVNFIFYGPHSFENASLLRSVLTELDFSHDFLAANNVYLLTDTPSPRRSPEEWASQWWERTDFRAKFNELCTEQITLLSGSSVEVKVFNELGQVADITVTSEE